MKKLLLLFLIFVMIFLAGCADSGADVQSSPDSDAPTLEDLQKTIPKPPAAGEPSLHSYVLVGGMFSDKELRFNIANYRVSPNDPRGDSFRTFEEISADSILKLLTESYDDNFTVTETLPDLFFIIREVEDGYLDYFFLQKRPEEINEKAAEERGDSYKLHNMEAMFFSEKHGKRSPLPYTGLDTKYAYILFPYHLADYWELGWTLCVEEGVEYETAFSFEDIKKFYVDCGWYETKCTDNVITLLDYTKTAPYASENPDVKGYQHDFDPDINSQVLFPLEIHVNTTDSGTTFKFVYPD